MYETQITKSIKWTPNDPLSVPLLLVSSDSRGSPRDLLDFLSNSVSVGFFLAQGLLEDALPAQEKHLLPHLQNRAPADETQSQCPSVEDCCPKSRVSGTIRFPRTCTSSSPLSTGGRQPRERQKKWEGVEEKGIKENSTPGVQPLHGVGPPRPFILSLMEDKQTFPFICFMNFLTGIGYPRFEQNSLVSTS